MQALKNELTEKNIIWVTPENENLLYPGVLESIFTELTKVAEKNKNENFNMMPKLLNIRLITDEIVEGIANANFKCGQIELLGIFLYDYTKIKYEDVKSILCNHFFIRSLN